MATQAVEMLRSTGKVVRLKLVRYVHGLKFEQLQQAIANSQNNSQANTPQAGTGSGMPQTVAARPAQQQQQQHQPKASNL